MSVSSSRWDALALVFVTTGAAGAVSACGDDSGGSDAPAPLFPADYLTSYTEVRDCRQSGDHDLNVVRMLASPSALEPYQGRALPFPEGAVVLKEEYDLGDVDCTGPIKQWTVMERLAPGTSPETLDWTWQRLDAERTVAAENGMLCIACHSGCGVAPEGYQGTCAVP
jgi:hypothetical protein